MSFNGDQRCKGGRRLAPGTGASHGALSLRLLSRVVIDAAKLGSLGQVGGSHPGSQTSKIKVYDEPGSAWSVRCKTAAIST